MKIVEKQNFVKVEGDVEVKHFGIVFNAKMVHMLSDSLYQDKILAIVRELRTNAHDSQVENGNPDVPVEVHLPTASELFFSIRDFGTGLSPERVDNVYLFYGGSDRTESNDYTGGMGLGSKTPFCYHTKTFTVDSWYNGIHYCYAAYIGEDGKPNLAPMSQAESDEPSGVMIKLPVARHDVNDFSYAAKKVFSIFPVAAKMTGYKIDITPPKYVLASNDGTWKLREDGNGCRVIMGNVAYELHFDDSDVNVAQRNVMNSDFDIFVDIGGMSVEMSREGLSYDNRTKVKARYLINKIITDFNAKIQEEIDKCPNLWSARVKYSELYDLARVKVMDGSKILYKGIKLFDTLQNMVSLEKFTQSKTMGVPASLHIIGIRKDRYSPKYDKTNRVNSISTKNKVKFFRNDLTVGSFVRAAEISQQTGCLVLLFSAEDDVMKEVMETIGCDISYFPLISSVPSPTVRKSGKRRGCITKVVTFARRRHATDSKSAYWANEQDVDIANANGVYVEFNRYYYRNTNGMLDNPKNLNYTLNMLEEAGITIPTIYGIKTADLKYLKKSTLVPLTSYMQKKVQQLLETVDITKVLHYHEQFSKVGKSEYYARAAGQSRLGFDQLVRIKKLCKKESPFTKFVESVSVVQSIINSYYDKAVKLHRLAVIFSVALPKYPDLVKLELDKVEKEVYNMYPMVGFVDAGIGSSGKFDKIAEYIDFLS